MGANAILDNLLTIMYMLVKPSGSIEAFMTRGEKGSLKVSPNIADDSWT
jgi:hypothetical protein